MASRAESEPPLGPFGVLAVPLERLPSLWIATAQAIFAPAFWWLVLHLAGLLQFRPCDSSSEASSPLADPQTDWLLVQQFVCCQQN